MQEDKSSQQAAASMHTGESAFGDYQMKILFGATMVQIFQVLALLLQVAFNLMMDSRQIVRRTYHSTMMTVA
jgi:hypothetical protein